MIRLRRRRLHPPRHWRLSESTGLPSHRTLRSSPLRSFFQKRRRVLAYYSVFIYSSLLFSSRFRFAEGSSSIHLAPPLLVLYSITILFSALRLFSPLHPRNTTTHPYASSHQWIPFNFPFLYLYLFFRPPFSRPFPPLRFRIGHCMRMTWKADQQ